MAAAGHQAEAAIEEARKKHKGNYILAVEGNPPLNGTACTACRRPALPRAAEGMRGRRQGGDRLGRLRLVGLRAGRQAEPTQAVPIHKVITDKPIIRCRAARRSPR